MNEVAFSRSPTRYPMIVVSSSDVFVMASTRYSPTRYPITAFAVAPSIAFAVARLQNECMDVLRVLVITWYEFALCHLDIGAMGEVQNPLVGLNELLTVLHAKREAQFGEVVVSNALTGDVVVRLARKPYATFHGVRLATTLATGIAGQVYVNDAGAVVSDEVVCGDIGRQVPAGQTAALTRPAHILLVRWSNPDDFNLVMGFTDAMYKHDRRPAVPPRRVRGKQAPV